MLDVSAKLVDVAVKQFRVAGLDVARLGDGLALAGFTNHDSFTHWNDLVEFFARADEAIGHRGRMVELSEAAAVAGLPEGQVLMALSPDIVSGIHLINRLADATFGPNLRYPAFRRTGPGRFHVRLRHPQRRGFRSNIPYFQGMEGAFRASPRYAGIQASASVRTLIQPHCADYEIELPFVAAPRSDSPEGAIKATFVRDWERALTAVRHGMLELRRAEIRARQSQLFADLSAEVSRALRQRESEALPQIAAHSIQKVLKCRHVAISRVGPAGKVALGVVGPAVRNARRIESMMGDDVLQVEADVRRDSIEAHALENLVPWLALVCGGASERPVAPVERSEPWLEARRRELAARWRLTPRQAQVAWLMTLGESNKGIAAQLGLTEGTVELHAHAVLQKSAISSRASLAAHFFNGS